nr:MAG TPA: hypothetical protein [Caudoviricetes sp.]
MFFAPLFAPPYINVSLLYLFVPYMSILFFI